jgi:hypothetical protein
LSFYFKNFFYFKTKDLELKFKFKMSEVKPILHYFDGRGMAESIRLTLAAVGIEVFYN